MTTVSAPSIKDCFLVFRDQCILLQEYYDMYRALYESGDDTKKVMTNTASVFFQQLNYMLVDHLKLQVAKLTDGEESCGRENLTVKNINRMLSDAGMMTTAISTASDGIHNYRDLIKLARNRLGAHFDKETMVTNSIIPGHTKKDIEDFFENLYQYVDAVGIAVGEGPLDFRCGTGLGDVYDLLSTLRFAIKHQNAHVTA